MADNLIVEAANTTTSVADDTGVSCMDNTDHALQVSLVAASSAVTIAPTAGGNTLLSAAINAAGNGDNTLVAGVAATTIKVWALFLVCNAAVNLYFRDDTAGTALTGVMNMLANGSITLDFTGEPWFTCTATKPFVLNLSGAQQVSGRVYYTQA